MTQEDVKFKKSLSTVNVWALALGCIIGWGAFVMPGNTFLKNGGPGGTAIAMGIASLIMIIISLNYNFMIRRYPVTGGELKYANIAFGKKHAFVCAWFLSMSYLAVVPLNATALALIGRNLMGGVFQVGFHYSVAGYDVYLGEILLAVFALIIFCALSIKGVKTAGVVQTGLLVLLLGGIAAVFVAALANPEATFKNMTPAFHPDVAPLSGIFAITAVVPWAFVGFDTIPQAAEEFNFKTSKVIGIMSLSILFGGLMYVALTLITVSVLPAGYDSWVTYIEEAPSLDGLLSLPTFYASYKLLGTAGLVLIGLAVLAAILSGIIGFYMASSRLIYSMAQEKMIPSWLGKLHPKYKTPMNAILFVMAISVLAPFFGRTALSWIVDMSSTGATIGYGYTSLAAAKIAWKEKNKGIVITGILGAVFALAFLFLLLVPVKGLNCCLNREAYICLVIWVFIGLIFYISSQKKKNKAEQ